ncbi:MAG: hypothetical protein ACE5D7_08040, partial [Fidelibacterota bacterium]
MFDLTIQGKLFVIVPVILIFVGLLFNYRKITRSRKNKLYSIAWILRLLVILITIFILADPFFHFTNTYEKKPDVSIFIDTSSSMAHNTEDLVPSVSEKLNELASWIDPKTDKLSIFEFNSSITPITNVNNIHFDHSLTDFSQIPGMIKSSGTAISFLITDGIATSGPDPSAIKLNSSQTIHVIAAENKTALKELSIDKTEYPQTAIEGDTITVKAVIGIQSTEDIRTEVQILDKSGNTIANIPVEATPGEGIREISLPVAIQNNQIPDIVSIITVPGEKNTLNNTFKLNLNILSENEHILFVTGALSPNTSMIKEISSSVPRAVVDHFFRLGGTTWNRPNNEFLSMKPKLIVLDNFPVMNEDRALYNGLIQYAKSNGIPIVFFEGANSDLLTSSLIGQTANLQAEPVQITSPQTISLTNPGKRYFDRYLTESLPPVKTINQWKSNSLHTDL